MAIFGKFLFLHTHFLLTMKTFYSKSFAFGYLCLFLMVISSCKSSSEFASSDLIQKRKYTKGYHLNFKSNGKDDRLAKAQIDKDGALAQAKVTEASPEVLEASVDRIIPQSQLKSNHASKQKVEIPAHSNFHKMGKFRMRINDRNQPPAFSTDDPEYYQHVYGARKTPGLAIAGFISAIIGIFFAGIPLGILAIIFGAISLAKINGDPMRYSGKGLAIAAIIIGVVAIIGALIVISMLASQ